MASEKRVRENLVLICKRLSPEAFLMGVAHVLHPTDVELTMKKIERGTDLTSSLLVNHILDCLKRRPHWVQTFVAFLRQNDEIEILHKLGEQVSEQTVSRRGDVWGTDHFPHSAAPAFTAPLGSGHRQQQPDLDPSRRREVTKPREAAPGVWSDPPPSGLAKTAPTFSCYGFAPGITDVETKNYQYQINENAAVNEHKTPKSNEFDVTLKDVVNNMGLKRSQTYPGLASRQASYVSPQQSGYHHSVSYGELGFTAENLSPPEENEYGKAEASELSGCTMNYEMIGLNLGSAGQDTTTGPGRPQGIIDLSEAASNTDNRNNSFQFPKVPVDVEEETAPLLRPGHRNVTEDLSPGNVTEDLSLGNVIGDLSLGNVIGDLSLRHFSREDGDIPVPVGLQLTTLGQSLQVDSGSSGDVSTHGVGSAYGAGSALGVDSDRAHGLPRCPPSEAACVRNAPEHNSSGGSCEALPSPLQNEARSDIPTSDRSHNHDLEIDEPGEVSSGGSGARTNRSRENLASTTSNQLCAGFVGAEPNNGEGISPYREAAVSPCRSEPSVTSSPAVHDAPSSSCPPPSPSREYHRQPSTPVNIYIKNVIMNNDSSFNLASDVIANTVLGNNALESQRSATSCPERHPHDERDRRRPERELSSSPQQVGFALRDRQQLHQTQVKCPVCDAGQQEVPVSQSIQPRAPATDRVPCETTQGSHASAHPGPRRGPVAPLLMPPHPPNPGLSSLSGDDTRPRAADQTSEAEQLLEQHRQVLNTQLLPPLWEMSDLSGFELRQTDHRPQLVDTACLRCEENTLLKVPQNHYAAESACQGCEGENIEGQGHHCQGSKDDGGVSSQGRWDRPSARPSPDTQNNRGGEQRTTTAAVPTQCHPDLRFEKCPAVPQCRHPLPASHQDTRPTPGADLALPRACLASHGRQTGAVRLDPCGRYGNAPGGAPPAQRPEALSGLQRGPTVSSPSKTSGRESDSGVGGCRAEGGEHALFIPDHLRLANVLPHNFHLPDLKSLQSQSLELHPDILLRLRDEAAKANITGQTGHAEATMIGQREDQTNIFQQMQTELTEVNIPKLTMLLA